MFPVIIRLESPSSIADPNAMDGRGRGVLALCLLARVSVASEDFNEASTSTGTGAIQDYAAWDAAPYGPGVNHAMLTLHVELPSSSPASESGGSDGSGGLQVPLSVWWGQVDAKNAWFSSSPLAIGDFSLTNPFCPTCHTPFFPACHTPFFPTYHRHFSSPHMSNSMLPYVSPACFFVMLELSMKATILTTDKYPYTVAFSPILKSILRRSAMGALTVRDNPMFDPSKSFKLPRGTEPLREFRERPNEAKRKSRMYPRVFVYIDAILALFTLALFRLVLFTLVFPPPSSFPHSPIPPLFPCFLCTTGILQQLFYNNSFFCSNSDKTRPSSSRTASWDPATISRTCASGSPRTASSSSLPNSQNRSAGIMQSRARSHTSVTA